MSKRWANHGPREMAFRRAFKGIITGHDRMVLAEIGYQRASRKARRDQAARAKAASTKSGASSS